MPDLIGSFYAASMFCFWIVVAVALVDQITMNDGMAILGSVRGLSRITIEVSRASKKQSPPVRGI